MGPTNTLDGLETDVKTMPCEKPELYLLTIWGSVPWMVSEHLNSCIVLESSVRRCGHHHGIFNLSVKVLRGLEELEGCTFPKEGIQFLIDALMSMRLTMVLQHPRVVVFNSRSPPNLLFSSRNGKNKFDQPESLRSEHARMIGM